MFNYILKRFKKIVIRILLLIFFLIVLLMVFLYLNFRLNHQYPNPNEVFTYVENNKSTSYLNEKNKAFLQEKDIWAIRLDKEGKVTESFHKPPEVKNTFDLTDVARFTRFYLADYPVFTYVVGDGLLVFAYPKGSLDKLPSNYYNFRNLIFNLKLVLLCLVLFLLFVYLIYRIDINTIFKNILPFQRAIDNLYEEDYEKLDESGELKDLAVSINRANENYYQLKAAQGKWIRGVSHDVRTPLANISWELSKEGQDTLDIDKIQDQVLKISRIIEGLNLTLSLSNIDKDSFGLESPIKVIRKLIVDKLNDNSDREIVFENLVQNQNLQLKMNPDLFYRMLENILENALIYTKGQIRVSVSDAKGQLRISLSDEGKGLSESLIKKVNQEDLTNITRHGLGIFISKQIAELHNGRFILNNKRPGLEVLFIFDLLDER